jgi:hypothetical protein
MNTISGMNMHSFINVTGSTTEVNSKLLMAVFTTYSVIGRCIGRQEKVIVNYYI